MNELIGKVALVIGGSKNSGRAVVERLVHEGAFVHAVARDSLALMEIGLDDDQVGKSYALDMMPEGAIENLVAMLGDSVPDIIVHVIGGTLNVRDPLAPGEDWNRVMRLNLGIAVGLNRIYLPKMIARGWGRIVHFSSNAVTLHTGAPAYTTAKHALEGYVRRMGRMHADTGVIISAVRCGPIYTPGQFMYSQDEKWTRDFWEKYVPAKRWGTPEELARVVAFLCSEGSSFMPGAIVDCDGGMR